MQLRDKIKSMAEEKLENTGLFLVDVVAPETGKKIVVYIDGDEGVTIGDCSKLSRQLSKELDEKEALGHSYTLEVSSPGVSRPFSNIKQYKRNVGRNLQVTTSDDKVLTGNLLLSDEEKIVLQVRKDKKTVEDIVINFTDIKEAKVII